MDPLMRTPDQRHASRPHRLRNRRRRRHGDRDRLRLGNAVAIVLSVLLAFPFGYAFSMRPLLAAGPGLRPSLRLALAADTVSVATMEPVDNSLMLVIAGAIAAGLGDALAPRHGHRHVTGVPA